MSSEEVRANETGEEKVTDNAAEPDITGDAEAAQTPEEQTGTDSADNGGSVGGDKPDKNGKPEKPDKKEEKLKRKFEAELKGLGAEADKLRAALADEKDMNLRLRAEYDNYRKRTAAEKANVYADAYADVLKEILPVIDNLERALSCADDTTDADDKMTEGVKLTLNQFNDAMKKLGVEPVGEVGEKFDPNLHNAVMHEEDEEHGENEIVAVFQRGYKKGDRVLRFAMVKVVN